VATDLLPSLLGNLWSIALVVLFFGGSIFVHELGHFLAARRRGVLVERFSIGFGPPLWSRRGRDGVEYRIAWFPLGGYVLLPELADLGAAEGPIRSDLSGRPPVTYGTRMFVFAAGAACNLLFAFVLAVLLWALGQPMSSDVLSTRIGHVAPTLKLPDGREVPSPAREAGLEPAGTTSGGSTAARSRHGSTSRIPSSLAPAAGPPAGRRSCSPSSVRAACSTSRSTRNWPGKSVCAGWASVPASN